MRTSHRLAVLGAGLLAAALPAAAQAPSADSIIALNVAARGGLARLRAVRSQRMVGVIVLANGARGVDTVELARPGRVRTTVHFREGVLIQAADGSVAWTLNPFAGDTAPHPVTGDAARAIEAGADLDGPLVNHAAKGNRVTYAGVDTADGTPCWALDVVTAAGLHDRYYVDTVAHLQRKWIGIRPAGRDTLVFESYFRHWRRVDGVMIAFRIDSDTRGRRGGQHIQFTSAALDAPIDSARFRLPR
ncbi:MAG TPA: hypothetical protein VFT41_04140 [Gemmatimonadaceae bacterium]|nr:hypothetical protein [Gemmatimonadaceae bacterium]